MRKKLVRRIVVALMAMVMVFAGSSVANATSGNASTPYGSMYYVSLMTGPKWLASETVITSNGVAFTCAKVTVELKYNATGKSYKNLKSAVTNYKKGDQVVIAEKTYHNTTDKNLAAFAAHEVIGGETVNKYSSQVF